MGSTPTAQGRVFRFPRTTAYWIGAILLVASGCSQQWAFSRSEAVPTQMAVAKFPAEDSVPLGRPASAGPAPITWASYTQPATTSDMAPGAQTQSQPQPPPQAQYPAQPSPQGPYQPQPPSQPQYQPQFQPQTPATASATQELPAQMPAGGGSLGPMPPGSVSMGAAPCDPNWAGPPPADGAAQAGPPAGPIWQPMPGGPTQPVPPPSNQVVVDPNADEPLWRRMWDRQIANTAQDYRNYYSWSNAGCLLAGFGVGAVVANTNMDMEFQAWYQNHVRTRARTTSPTP